jgi:hypothetical protein
MRKYRTGDSWFTHETVERALDIHQDAGLIRSWHRDRRTPGPSGTRAIPLYVVTITDGTQLNLANIWEAHAFVCGIASARQAQQRKEAAEAAQRARDEEVRRQRLEEEHDREEKAISWVECTTCGQPAGTKCIRTVEDPTPYAAHPHAARMDRLRDRLRASEQQAVPAR